MGHLVRRALRLLGRALAVGLLLAGAVGVLGTLYLAPLWGLALLAGALGAGLLCLAVVRLLLLRRTRRAARECVAQVEDWLRTPRGRAGGAG